ncbi:MAG: AAA family ATPase [Chloroflexi bacterium]|nr:AAA family ATPase [Chloroflexota bacterium]
MKPVVIAFSGRHASGKSTLSTEIAARLACPRASFGDFVRRIAATRSTPGSVPNLQEVGARLIEEMGWDGFCRAVLAQAGWEVGQSLVVDGIRHAEALATLNQLVHPSPLVHIHIVVSDLEREDRLARREVNAPHPISERSETHSTEIQVGTVLPRIAQLVVDGGRPLEECAADVLDRVCHASTGN